MTGFKLCNLMMKFRDDLCFEVQGRADGSPVAKSVGKFGLGKLRKEVGAKRPWLAALKQ